MGKGSKRRKGKNKARAKSPISGIKSLPLPYQFSFWALGEASSIKLERDEAGKIHIRISDESNKTELADFIFRSVAGAERFAKSLIELCADSQSRHTKQPRPAKKSDDSEVLPDEDKGEGIGYVADSKIVLGKGVLSPTPPKKKEDKELAKMSKEDLSEMLDYLDDLNRCGRL